MIYILLFTILVAVFYFFAFDKSDGWLSMLKQSLSIFGLSLFLTVIVSFITNLIVSSIVPATTVTKVSEARIVPLKQDEGKEPIYARLISRNNLQYYTLASEKNGHLFMQDLYGFDITFIDSSELKIEKYQIDFPPTIRFLFWSSMEGEEMYKIYLPKGTKDQLGNVLSQTY